MSQRVPCRADSVLGLDDAGVIISFAIFLALLSGPAYAVDLPAFFVNPDPAVGQDQPDRGTRPDLPLQTIRYAFERGLEKVTAPDYVGPKGIRVQLQAGTYLSEGVAPQGFPVKPPAAFDRMEIVGAPPGVARLVGSNDRVPLIELEPYAQDRAVALEVRDVELVGGLAGFCAQKVESQSFRADFAGCTFVDQGSGGVEVYAEPKARLGITVRGCTFRGGRAGITVLGALEGDIELAVEDSTFHALRKYAPREMLGTGIDVYLAPLSAMRATVRRNKFGGVASAVQLTEAEEDMAREPSGGTLDVVVANNLVSGRVDPAKANDPAQVEMARVLNGIYLNLWPHHSNKVSILNNTFVGIDRHVVVHDNLLKLAEEGLDAPPFAFANNIAWGIGSASEFDDELFAFLGDEPGAFFPSPGTEIRHNLLEKSVLGGLDGYGNLAGDPRFVNEAGLDFRLAGGSPAIDAGDTRIGTDDSVDLDGLCRRAASECSIANVPYPIDLGAYERAGVCEIERASFLRGNCNFSNAQLDIGDAIFSFGYLFLGAASPGCHDACDSNDDGVINLSDGIYTLSFLFSGGPPPQEPYPLAGPDPTRDCLEPCRQ